MHMETLNCGYPLAQAALLGSASISPPVSPTSNCSQLYSETQYAQPTYSSSPLHDTSSFSSKYDDAYNNNNIIINNDTLTSDTLYDNSLLNDLSNMSISEADELSLDGSSYPPSSTPSRPRSKKNSRSKSKSSTSSTDTNSSRKDSFVYDVRMTDEQFLFFVPDLDLVKSHLMFAVREEVDVLKEKIVELMDRINHLECENNLLRQYASPEVIQQLQTTIPHQLQQQQSHHSTTS